MFLLEIMFIRLHYLCEGKWLDQMAREMREAGNAISAHCGFLWPFSLSSLTLSI